ncbi:MAG: hypothetical protein JWQ59_229 [Cryobacterium sp.]|nr:hypothetical protein [Cryobacterium sp.]
MSGDPDERDLRRLPHALRRAIEVAPKQDSGYTAKQKVIRGLIDYIASLSDAEAYYQHAVLKGREPVGHLCAVPLALMTSQEGRQRTGSGVDCDAAGGPRPSRRALRTSWYEPVETEGPISTVGR